MDIKGLDGLKRCPFCYLQPLFEIRGMFIRGGCAEHLPDAVMQPADMPEEAVKQWNNAIAPIEAMLRNQGGK